MAGYIGSKAVNLSTTGADIAGDADVSGDLTVDTSTLHVDSANNRVGVGTDSPSSKVHVYSGASGASPTADLVIEDNLNVQIMLACPSANQGIISFADPASNNSGRIRYRHVDDSMRFDTNQTEAMLIDSAGRVTTPSQPYFAAEINGNSNYVTASPNTAIPFNAVVHNIGSHFNTSTYRFTAPVTGKYLMAVGLIHNEANPTGRIMFYLNGNADGGNMKWGINGSNTAGGGSHTATAIIYMSANDYVDVRSQSGNINNYQAGHSSWTGMLIG